MIGALNTASQKIPEKRPMLIEFENNLNRDLLAIKMGEDVNAFSLATSISEVISKKLEIIDQEISFAFGKERLDR